MASLQQKAKPLIRGAWAALGVPFDSPAINEKTVGIIDVEALVMATLLLMEQDRMATDLPAWLVRFSGRINHQKLKTMANIMPQGHRSLILENVNRDLFHGAPETVKRIFDVDKKATKAVSRAIEMRMRKLNTLENVARASLMIHNRLLYGAGFRADVITLTHLEGLNLRGRQLAKLLCTNDSTVSRILNDLRACRFLDRNNDRIGRMEPYPGMFLSTQSVWNLCEMIDALKFSHEELRRDAFEKLDLKQDGFGRKIFPGLVQLPGKAQI